MSKINSMKRTLIFINILLFITIVILVIFNKYYPSSIVEIYLSDYYTPDKISDAIGEKYPVEYLNIYEILSADRNVNVYTGNLNILLRNKKFDDYGISVDKNALVAGDKYIKGKYIFDSDNKNIVTNYGEYSLVAVIKNDNQMYYRDTNILEGNQIRRQRLFIVLDEAEGSIKYMNSDTILRLLRSEGIDYAVSVSYKDVSVFLKKLILIFCFIQATIMLAYNYKLSIGGIQAFISKYKSLKYDISFRDYIIKHQGIKRVLLLFGRTIIALVLLAILIILFVSIINTRMSFLLNITSYTSIRAAIMILVNLLNYFVAYGFTDISFVILFLALLYLIPIAFICIKAIAKYIRSKVIG